MDDLPSGYAKHSYGKWPFKVDFQIVNCDFSIAMLNYQRASEMVISPSECVAETFWCDFHDLY